MKALNESRAKVAKAFHEVAQNTPFTVKRSNVSPARKTKMKVAIALNKARDSGAKLPYAGIKRGSINGTR